MQAVNGNNNLQVDGDYIVFQASKKLDASNIDQKIEELKLAMGAVHFHLDQAERSMIVAWMLAAVFSIIFLTGIFLHLWTLYFISIVPLVAIGVYLQKPREKRRFLKIELKAHEQAFSELTKQKLLD